MTQRLLLGFALLLGFSLSARADDDLFTRDSLTGSWGGARPALAEKGIVLGADEIVDALGNPAGGVRQGLAFEGRFEIFANADMGLLAGMPGLVLHANAYQIHGKGLSADDVGNILTVGNIGATPATRLFTLWAQQSLFDDRLSIRLGQIAADDEFFVSQYAALFLNSTFGWPSVLGINLPSGGPAYPLATPGIRVRWALSPAWVISAALINGDPAPSGPGDPQLRDAAGAAFRTNGGAFWITEIAHTHNLALWGDPVPGTFKLGGWYHNGSFADQWHDAGGLSLADPASSGLPALHPGDYGFYAIVDQLLWRAHGTSDQGFGAFVRLGAAPPERNLIAFHADAGFTYAGLWPGRDNDMAGFAFSYEKVSGDRSNLGRDTNLVSGLPLPLPDYEAALEWSYQAAIAPWWVAQPDLQLILHPGAHLGPGTPGNAVIAGLRTAISL